MRTGWAATIVASFFICGCGGGGGGGGGSQTSVVPSTPVPSGAPGGVARAVHSVTIALAQPYPALGTVATIPITVTAKDLSGNPISPPDTYATPVTLIDQDLSGHTTLSKTLLLSPSDSVSLKYDGAYFPSAGLTATWADPTGTTIQPFRQIATGVPTVENSLGTGRVVSSLTLGGDGALWFGERASIGRTITGSGATYFPTGGGWSPVTVATGPDGAVWFSAFGFGSVVTPAAGVGRIALDGTYGPIWATSSPYNRELVAATDGNMYLNQLNGFTRIAPSGAMTTIPITYQGNRLHTDTLAAGADGALWTTSLGTLFRLDLGTGTVTNAPFPIPPGAIRPIEPVVLYALADGRLYYDDAGAAIYDTTPPSMSATFLASGANIPHQGSALSASSMALARDGSLWFTSAFTTLDGHPWFGHVVGNGAEMLVGQSAVAHQNANFQDVPASSLVRGSDGHLWYARSDVIGTLLP
jgi:virginiamycin B lyase